MRYLVLSVMTLMLLSCARLPPNGTGGFAQHYLFTPQYQQTLNPKDKHYYLYPMLLAANCELKDIRRAKMSRCYPAYIYLLDNLMVMSAQQFAQGHFKIAHNGINKMHCHLKVLKELIKLDRCQHHVPEFKQLLLESYA